MILLLSHFPTLYKDELLYSGIARYHQQSCNKSQKQTINDLFGQRLVCATSDLPSHLKQLSLRLDERYSVEQLIRDHTLFPYFTYFMTQDRCSKVYTAMEEGSSQGEVHVNLGLPASNIKAPSYLRFCPKCIDTEIELSEPYWHRSHQLPGVFLCPIHMIPLKTSNVAYSTQDHKFSFVPLSKLINEQHQVVQFEKNWLNHLEFIASQSSELLNSVLPFTNSISIYRGFLEERGYLTLGGSIRFDHMIFDFRNFYSDRLLEYLQCVVSPSGSDTWLHKIVRNKDEITHPLRHLLLIRFLGKTVDSLLVPVKIHPFGEGPWPCLNKAADHFKNVVIDQCVVSQCSKTSRPVGTFHCSCGFVYSRRGPDTSTSDRFKVGRIKAFGLIWYQKLEELNGSGKSLRSIAAILGVDPGTVKTQSARLGNNLINIKPVRKERSLLKRKSSSRRIRDEHTALNRADWNQRDDFLCKEVEIAVTNIRSSPELQRITVASITRFISAGDLTIRISKNLSKLPRTNELIKNNIESTETYQIRRLIYAAEKIKRSEFKVNGWKLLKVAGLNLPLNNAAYRMFNDLIS